MIGGSTSILVTQKKTNHFLSATLKSDKKIRATASQMLLLVRTLPFLIGDKISENEDHWMCFMLLSKIFDVVLSPVITENLLFIKVIN